MDQILYDYFAKFPEILLVGIYGSQVKGKATPTSDVDICIASNQKLSIELRIQFASELSRLLKKEVDLLDLNAAEGVILKEALVEAKWLTKNPLLLARLMKKMIFYQTDFKPYYDRMLKAKRERFLK